MTERIAIQSADKQYKLSRFVPYIHILESYYILISIIWQANKIIHKSQFQAIFFLLLLSGDDGVFGVAGPSVSCPSKLMSFMR